MKKIIEVEIGFPKSIVQYEGEPITTMISTEQLQEELNLQLLQPNVIKSVCDHPFAFVMTKCNGEINHCLKCGEYI